MIVEPKKFNYFSIFDWILVSFCLLTVVNLALNMRHYIQLRALFVLINTKGATVLKFHYTCLKSTTPQGNTAGNSSFGQLLAQYLPTELILVILIILALILIWLMARKRWRTPQIGSIIFMDVINQSHTVRVYLNKLWYPPSFYQFKIAPTMVKISMGRDYFLLQGIKLQWIGLELQEKCTGKFIQLLSQKYLTIRRANRCVRF